jgi:Starch-binding associating with outer membrane
MKKILIIPIIALLFVSCKKFLGDNLNTATPTVAPANTLLPPVFSNMLRGYSLDAREAGQYINYWGVYTSGNVWERHGYARGSDRGGEIWRMVYFGLGKNLELILEDAVKEQKWEFAGVATAIKAWSYQVATDYHGDILKISQVYEPNRFVFDYSSQQEVYDKVPEICQTALDYFARGDGKQGVPALFPSADLVYAGDKAKWIKFVYGILARNANNRSNKSTYDPDKVIGYVNKSLSSNNDNFLIPSAGTNSDNASFWGPLKIPSSYPSINSTWLQGYMIGELMNGNVYTGIVDPRAPLILSASPDGKFRGAKPTVGDPNRNASTAIINPTEIPSVYGLKTNVSPVAGQGKYLFKDATSHPVMTYAELQFIKAEAAFRKGDKPTAYTAMKNGVQADMDRIGVTSVSSASYLSSTAVPASAAALTNKDIMLQKYIALWPHGALETWLDMRRYKYDTTIYTRYTLLPDISLAPNGTFFEDNNNKMAQRVRPRYNSEYIWNINALALIGADLIDYHTKEIWISKP